MPSEPERRGSQNLTDEYQTCPKCGCPHKMASSICSYCGSPLSRKAPISERLRRAVETVKWRYKLKGPRSVWAAGGVFSKAVTFSLGVALVLLGGWFFVRAVGSSSFSEFLIGSLFLVYGVYSSAVVLRGKD